MADKIQKIRGEVVRLHNLLPVMDGDNISVNYADRICTALKMYIDSLQEEPVSEDLEKAAEQDVCEVVNTCSATGIPNDHIPSWVQDAMINEYIHGAKWKKEQMMKGAYDAYVSYIRDNSEAVVHLKNTSITMSSHFPKRDLEEGDKLKIVVIKEE